MLQSEFRRTKIQGFHGCAGPVFIPHTSSFVVVLLRQRALNDSLSLRAHLVGITWSNQRVHCDDNLAGEQRMLFTCDVGASASETGMR
jgi:hypothetical protein